jgi:hypothetical protein
MKSVGTVPATAHKDGLELDKTANVRHVKLHRTLFFYLNINLSGNLVNNEFYAQS